MLEADKFLALGCLGFHKSQHRLIRLHGQDLGDAVGRGRGLAEHNENAVDTHDALNHHIKIGEEGQNDAGLDLSAVDPPGAEPDHQRQAQIEAHLHQRAGDGHNGAGLDVGPGHGVAAGGEAPGLVAGFGQGLDHPDAGDILPHDLDHLVQPGLDLAVEGDAVAGHGQNHRHQHRHDDQENGRQGRVHQQRHHNAAYQHHRHPDAHGLGGLDRRLDVVAIAGQAADEAGQTEPVELRAGEIQRLGEEGLPDVVGDAMGVVHGDAVGPDVELPGQNCRDDHQGAPEEHQGKAAPGHDFVDQVFENVGDQQLRQGAGQLDGHGPGDPAAVEPHMAQNQVQGARLLGGFHLGSTAQFGKSIRPKILPHTKVIKGREYCMYFPLL